MEELNLTGMLLTQNSTFIIGPIAEILGKLMNLIFTIFPNIGLSIIILTIVIYLCMMPLTIKQQKFSKLSAKMNPELQAIQKKYKDKKDNDSMAKMNEETQRVYKKYGVSPTGSCVQLIIQMPILFALYRVINNVPAYVTKIRTVYDGFVINLSEQTGSADFIQTFKNAVQYKKQFESDQFVAGSDYMHNTFIDVLNKASTAEWNSLISKFSTVSGDVQLAFDKLTKYNNFLGLNIGNSPSYIIKESFSNGSYLLMVGALLVPILAGLTQFLNVKLMPQAPQSSNGSGTMDSMQASMKTMNLMMPIMSAFFCFTFPTGMGIYWIAGSVVRSIQQVLINKHIDKIDFDELVKKNMEKAAKKPEKKNVLTSMLNMENANTPAIPKNASSTMSQSEKEEAIKKAKEYYKENAKPGSIAEKANMVKQYNEKNNSK